MSGPVPRKESSKIYERLLRGEATSREFVEALRREAQVAVREMLRRRHPRRP